MTDLPQEGARTAGDARLELRPLYRQARDILVQRIIAGVWPPGSYLPSETHLAGELGVSIGTIRKAADDLAEQGLLERQHGRGTRVAAHSSASTRFRFLRFVHGDGRPLEPIAHVLARTVQKASEGDRAHLDLAKGETVLELVRTRTEAGQTLVYERIGLPAQVFARFDAAVGDVLGEEVYVLYQRLCGVTIVRTRDRVGLDAAAAEAARHLGVAVGAPLLKVDRVAYGLDGRRVEYRQSWTATLRYQTELD